MVYIHPAVPNTISKSGIISDRTKKYSIVVMIFAAYGMKVKRIFFAGLSLLNTNTRASMRNMPVKNIAYCGSSKKYIHGETAINMIGKSIRHFSFPKRIESTLEKNRGHAIQNDMSVTKSIISCIVDPVIKTTLRSFFIAR